MKQLFVTLILFAVTANCIAQDSAWKLLGNAGTTNSNFLGTTDNRPLLFRVNNLSSGRIDPISSNSFFGFRSGAAVTTGRGNTATGANALRNITIGVDNTASGYQSLHVNTTGSYNTAYGVNSLQSNTTGNNNVALGNTAMFFNTAGVNNTGVGLAALFRNTTGVANVAMGFRALYQNQQGSYLVAIGDSALYNNTSGTQNTAVGSKAGYNTNEGRSNSFFGYQAGYTNTRGRDNTGVGWRALYNTWGDANAAFGNESMYENGFGAANAAFGHSTLHENTNGLANTAIGQQALYNNTTGNFNTGAGSNAGRNFKGEYNTFLGSESDATADGFDHSTALGVFSRVTASDQVRIGNNTTASIGGFVNWSNVSDGRFKKNVQQNVPGLEFILQLQPVTYNLDVDGLNNWLSVNDSTQQNGTSVFSGFIAQDVEAIAKKIKYQFSGIDAPKNEKDLYALRYAEFVVPLVKAIQDQQKIIEELQNQLQQVKAKLGMDTIITKQ
jgi:hypothetical protein